MKIKAELEKLGYSLWHEENIEDKDKWMIWTWDDTEQGLLEFDDVKKLIKWIRIKIKEKEN